MWISRQRLTWRRNLRRPPAKAADQDKNQGQNETRHFHISARRKEAVRKVRMPEGRCRTRRLEGVLFYHLTRRSAVLPHSESRNYFTADYLRRQPVPIGSPNRLPNSDRYTAYSRSFRVSRVICIEFSSGARAPRS